VDFELSEEQELFRRTLRDYAEKEIMPVAPEWERTGRYPTEIVESFKEFGLYGLNVPEEYGGLEADRVSYALAFEEIARAWLGAAGLFGPHSVACWIVSRNGTPEQKAHWLPRMATGEVRSGICLTEPGREPTCRASGRRRSGTATTTWCRAPRPGSPTPGSPACSPSW